MPVIDDYIASVNPEERAEFERISRMVQEAVPSPGQGLSYGMPAYLYRGWPLISFVVTKKFLSIYPFSGKVVELLKDKLSEFETTPGSIHFSVGRPIPDELLREIIAARMREIEAKPPR